MPQVVGVSDRWRQKLGKRSQQMNMRKILMGGLLVTAAIGGIAACSSGGNSSDHQAAEQPAAAAAVAPAMTQTPSHASKPASHAAVTPTDAAAPPAQSDALPQSWVMPNEVGKVLQDAQDDVQRASGDPVFVSHSQDATGQDRFQVLDSNWKVCSQNIAAGHQVAWDGHVVFTAVKLSETCP